MHLISSNSHQEVFRYEDLSNLKDQDWVAADLHVHSIYSHDVLPARALHPDDLYREARNRGMNYFTLTDHDTMQAFDILGQEDGLVTGVEIKIKDLNLVGHTIHINIYDLNKAEFMEVEEIARVECDLKKLLKFLNNHGLPFIYNHPFWFEPKESPNLKVIPEIVKLFPVIEYNMHQIRRKNELTIELARRYEKGLVAATDTHSGNVGKIFTLAKGDTFREYFKNIAAGKSYLVFCDMRLEDIIDEVNTWIKLIFDSGTTRSTEAQFSTGLCYLDKLIWALTSETLRNLPRLSKVLEFLAYKISNSGIPAYLYLTKENCFVPEIEGQISKLFSCLEKI